MNGPHNSVELAPLAHLSEIDDKDMSSREMRLRENTEGIDAALLPGEEEFPVNRSREPHSPTPVTPEREGESYPASANPTHGIPKRGRPLDVNLYATKKTVAQGMMDLALLTANANQLRYVLESGNNSGPYFYFSVVLISLSIILQLVVGVVLIFVGRFNIAEEAHAQQADKLNNWVVLMLLLGIALIFLGKYNMKLDDHAVKADRLNNLVVLGVFLITAINMFISAFGIDPIEKIDPALIVDAAMSAVREKTTAAEPGTS